MPNPIDKVDADLKSSNKSEKRRGWLIIAGTIALVVIGYLTLQRMRAGKQDTSAPGGVGSSPGGPSDMATGAGGGSGGGVTDATSGLLSGLTAANLQLTSALGTETNLAGARLTKIQQLETIRGNESREIVALKKQVAALRAKAPVVKPKTAPAAAHPAPHSIGRKIKTAHLPTLPPLTGVAHPGVQHSAHVTAPAKAHGKPSHPATTTTHATHPLTTHGGTRGEYAV